MRLIGLNRGFELTHQRRLRVDLLLRVGERPGRLVALEIELGVLELRLVLGLGRFRLIKRRLERTRIDLSQNVARFDVLAFGESDLVQLAIDPDLHGDGVEGLDGAESREVNRDILLLGHADGGGDRLRFRGRRSGMRRRRGAARQTPRQTCDWNHQQVPRRSATSGDACHPPKK